MPRLRRLISHDWISTHVSSSLAATLIEEKDFCFKSLRFKFTNGHFEPLHPCWTRKRRNGVTFLLIDCDQSGASVSRPDDLTPSFLDLCCGKFAFNVQHIHGCGSIPI